MRGRISEDRPDPQTLNHEPSTFDNPKDLLKIVESIARHAAYDIKAFRTSVTASSCSYTPFDEGGVINAAAYRAFLLTSTSQNLSNDDYRKMAERNLNFVLENQNADGSWFYAVDGVRDFVDHYHTCFVMKALAKIHALTGHEATLKALEKGVDYYLTNLFDEEGLPKPFSKAPRLTVYKRELYDCAECINLCLLLRDRFPAIRSNLGDGRRQHFERWVKPDGSFRSREVTSWLGQRSHASLGPGANVSKPRLLSQRGFETRISGVRDQRSEIKYHSGYRWMKEEGSLITVASSAPISCDRSMNGL